MARPKKIKKERVARALPGAFEVLPPKVRDALAMLTVPERKFVLAYVSRANGQQTLAAQIAGIGNTYSSHATFASKMMTDPHIIAAIEAWLDAFTMSAVDLTYRIADMARANVGPFTEWQAADGTIKIKCPTEETWEANKHWIQTIEADSKTGQVTRVQLHSSFKAMELLSKIRKLHSDAPIVAFNVRLSRMSDEELLAEMEAMREQMEVPEYRVHDTKALPPGPQEE